MVVMMFWYGGHWAWWQGGLMWVGMIVFWGLLIWGAYALITGFTRKPPDTGHSNDDALGILDSGWRAARSRPTSISGCVN
jgi:hypothetical protein